MAESKEFIVKGIKTYENGDPDYPGISLDYQTKDGTLIGLVTAEVVDGVLSVYVWGDLQNEDYTNKFAFPISELEACADEPYKE